MPDQPFIVNDRRKFTADGDLRPDAPPSEPKPPRPHEEESSARLITMPEKPSAASVASPAEQPPAAPKGPQAVPSPSATASSDFPADSHDPNAPEEMPPLTAEQIEQSTLAYQATVDRLDTAIRAANPGMEQLPDMNFERLVQSVYMQAIYQLGGTADGNQAPQVDLLGARQSIDMLATIAGKSAGNLSANEDRLLQSALFEMRMAFLEVTQALARQASARQGGPTPGAPTMPPAPSGPSIVR